MISSSRHVTIQVQPFLVHAQVCTVYMCCSHLATHTCTWKEECASASLSFTNCMHVAACFLLMYVFLRRRAKCSCFVVVHRQSNAVLCRYVQQVTGTCTTHAYATATIRYQEVYNDSHIVWKQHENQGSHTTSNVHIMCHLLRSCIQCTRDAVQVGMPAWAQVKSVALVK